MKRSKKNKSEKHEDNKNNNISNNIIVDNEVDNEKYSEGINTSNIEIITDNNFIGNSNIEVISSKNDQHVNIDNNVETVLDNNNSNINDDSDQINFIIPQKNNTTNFSSSSSSSPTKPVNSQLKDIPSINDFFKSLDKKYGDGLFTQFSNNFIDESVDVLDILTLNDSDFNSLGVKKIGIRSKMIREAKKYKDLN